MLALYKIVAQRSRRREAPRAAGRVICIAETENPCPKTLTPWSTISSAMPVSAPATQAFYNRVKADDLLGPMYPPDDFEGARQRLCGFLIFRFGGPATYIEQRGHPRLRMRHAPFPVDQTARDRWVTLMDAALAESELPPEADRILREFFHNNATFLINRVSAPLGPLETRRE